MIKSIRNWLNNELRQLSSTVVAVPENLPEDPSVTYNPMLHDTTGKGSLPTIESGVPTMARWRVRRESSSDVPVETVAATPPHFVGPGADALSAGYTLHRMIAQGGFGEIWEATQETLGRVVAVKRLRQDLIDKHKEDPVGLQRLETAFRQEALVAACLEHPNILPVHDLGLDEDGHLLLATKLVRGRPWDEILRRDRHLPVARFLDKHLPILESLSLAVAFAHSRGVIHRDLKPTQVMVGEFGEVLLMDWGIAMFIHETPPIPTLVDSTLLTLAPTPSTASNPAGTVTYMAPEQTEATVRNIGPWTDIYLLGGILYELITCRCPHDGESRHQSFYMAATGVVPSPWMVAPNREIPGELAAIAMACLEPEPAKRLSSVEQFIESLREYRAGASRRLEAAELIQTVHAHQAPDPDYKTLVHDQSVVSRALSLWPEFEAASRLHEALALRHARLALANLDLKLARIQAERLPEHHDDRAAILREVDRLEGEQAQARERLDHAYQQARIAHARADRLVTFLLDDLHQSLQAVNRLDLMAKVGLHALEYFESLSGEETTADTMAKRAIACRNIGDVFRDQGNLEGASSAFRNFQEIARRLLANQPGERAAICLYAWACERISAVEYLRGNMAESLRLLDEGLSHLDTAPPAAGPDPDGDFLRARLTHQNGIVIWRRRKLDEAHALQAASLEIHKRLAEENPARTDYRAAHAWNLSTLGNVYRDMGNLPRAIRETELGLAIRQDLLDLDGDNKSFLDDVCWSLTNLALLKEYTGDFVGALDLYVQAGVLRRRLVDGDPTNAVHRNKLTFILSSRGRNLYGLSLYAEAAEVTQESCAISRALVEADPANVHEVGSHALNLGYAGLVQFALGNLDAAHQILLESRPAARRALDAVPENGVFQNAYCQSLILEGLLHERNEEEGIARACWEEALVLLDKQFWRHSTGQGMGMHLELSLYLGRKDDALADAEQLRKNNWMMPRWEALLAKRG